MSSRITPVSWGQPGVPRSVTRPSWIGAPSVATPAPKVLSIPPAFAIEPAPLRSSPPPSIAPASRPLGTARASGSVHLIQTTREVELEGELAALRGEVARLAEALASARTRVLEESEPELVRLAVAVAARVVGHELSTDPTTLIAWMKEGLTALPRKGDVTVAIAPDIAAMLSSGDAAVAIGAQKLVVDASLRAGSCELREGSSIVEVGADARVAAITDALGVDR